MTPLLATMHYHPDLAATLAEARTADLHAAAGGRHDAREGDASETQQRRSPGSIQLDAYPRLCGLPVTVERIPTSGARRADAAAVKQGPPDQRTKSATGAGTKHPRRGRGLFGQSKRGSVDGDRTRSGPLGGQHPNHSGRRKPQGSSL